MSAEGDAVFIRHMLDAISRAESYLKGVDKVDFLGNVEKQDAVIRQLSVLGEAAVRVSREVCARHPEVPWSDVTGIRHRLIHDYLGVDVETVWRTASSEAPSIRSHLKAILSSLEGQ